MNTQAACAGPFLLRRLSAAAITLSIVSIAGASWLQKQVGTPASAAIYPGTHKHALLVGISEYCRQPESECRIGGRYWWNLHSKADVEALRTVLMSEPFNFKAEDIKVLWKAQDTTHDQIIKEFQEFLIDNTQPGDIVYFHYSGHGTELPDDVNSRYNPIRGESLDGMDASLVPSDYVLQSDGSNNIRGDEISILLAKLSHHHPASVTLTIDSCYSGTVTRGGRSLVRGATYAGPPTPPGPPTAKERSPSGLTGFGELESLGYVLLAATGNKQVANETPTDDMGEFTSALVVALKGANSSTTYRDIFERVSKAVTGMYRNQTPVIEGAMNKIVMTGVTLPTETYFPVQASNGRVTLQYGSLQGITTGSTYSIYGPETHDFHHSRALADADVAAVAPTSAELHLSSPDSPDLKKLDGGRAIETQHNFGNMRLRLKLEPNATLVFGKSGIDKLGSVQLLQVVDDGEWDVLVCKGPCPNETEPSSSHDVQSTSFLTLERLDGSVIKRVSSDADPIGDVIQAAKAEARWRYFTTLDNNTPWVQIKMRLVPVKNITLGPPDNHAVSAEDVAKEVAISKEGRNVVHVGDTFMFEVINTGYQAAYVTVLDFRSDSTIGPVWPYPQVTSEKAGDNRIEADGQWHRIPFPIVMQIKAPLGPEVFLAIATSQASDFSSLVDYSSADVVERGTPRGGKEAQGPLGAALMFGTLGRVRGELFGFDPSNVSLPVTNWSTASVSVEVRPSTMH